MNAKANVVEAGIEAVTPRSIKLAASIADKPAQWIVNFLLVMSAGFIGWGVTFLPDKIAANTQTVRDDFSAVLRSTREDFVAENKRIAEDAKEKLTMVLTHTEKLSAAHREHEKEILVVLKEIREKVDRGPRIKTDGGAQ